MDAVEKCSRFRIIGLGVDCERSEKKISQE